MSEENQLYGVVPNYDDMIPTPIITEIIAQTAKKLIFYVFK
jgi:hypothetical protein